MKRCLLLAPLALAIGLPMAGSVAFAQDNGAEATGPKQAKADRKKVCKIFKITGSRLAAYRECRTKAEWDKYEDEQRQSFKDTRARVEAAPDNEG